LPLDLHFGTSALAALSIQWENTCMTKLSIASFSLLAGLFLAGSAIAQQPAKPSPAPAAAPSTQASQAPQASQPPQAAAAEKPQPALSNPEAAALLKTEKDKVSYAIGMNIGNSLHKQSVDVDPNLLVRGLTEALAGGQTLLTDEEAKGILTKFQASMRQKQQEKMQEEALKNKKEGDEFLAANKTKEGVVTLPSGLQYKVIKPGDGPKPAATDTVTVNYKGTLLDGTEFDGSEKRKEPSSLPVDKVIKGWSEALQLMPVGSKWQIYIPSDLGYGPRGAPPNIPPNSTLTFDVELLSTKPKEQPAAKPGSETAPKPQPDQKPQAQPQTTPQNKPSSN
jgi:FKBP-type peptidyl-prolyl cis-trans isomerase FklB